MSTSALAEAVRNHLRYYLTDFYGTNAANREANCKVMLSQNPTASCGEEFISIYGGYHKAYSADPIQAIDEEFGVNVAVIRKIAVIPPDRRGELGYTNIEYPPDGNHSRFSNAWKSVEDRCREIVGLVAGKRRFQLLNAANELLDSGTTFSESLKWLGTDAKPREVGPEFFWGYNPSTGDSDDIFGLVMEVRFGGAVRCQPVDQYDVSDDDYDPPVTLTDL